VLSLPPSVQIFVASEPADMRRSFDGLSAMVVELLEKDPFSGHLFVFRNRRGDRVKILYWDRSGFGLWYKRLETGVFRFPAVVAGYVELTASELALILEGIDLRGAHRQKRYERPNFFSKSVYTQSDFV
jgi:transposase